MRTQRRLRRRDRRPQLAVALCLLLHACDAQSRQALGTLEYDRITLPAPAAERIVEIRVREGERVGAGQLLLRLDETLAQAAVTAADLEAQRLRKRLSELTAGPRSEERAQARAQLAAAEATAREAARYYDRLKPLGRQEAIPRAELDKARAAAKSAEAEVRAARAAVAELEHGTRSEQLAQAEAAARAAEARAKEQRVRLEKLEVKAPRDGVVDSLPYLLGDQAPVGAPLAILLVGDAPHARVYVPEPIRARVHVGGDARVFVDGDETAWSGRVRMVRNEPSFTPYYALIGDDAARLSYLAEVQLTGEGAAKLPAGLPARVEFVP